MNSSIVRAGLHYLHESDGRASLLLISLQRPQFDFLVREGAELVFGDVFRCHQLVAKRDGMRCDLSVGRVRLPLTDWELAWDQLGFEPDAQFTDQDAIDVRQSIIGKILSGDIVNRRGQHGRKTNRSKGNAGAGDLNERSFFEALVHCRSPDESLYSAAKRALETVKFPANLVPWWWQAGARSLKSECLYLLLLR